MKPDDIPEEIWRIVEDMSVEGEKNPVLRRVQEFAARAAIQARSQAYEECAKIAENYKHGSSGFAANEPDKTVYGWGVARRSIAQAIRQHSQKGEDVNDR